MQVYAVLDERRHILSVHETRYFAEKYAEKWFMNSNHGPWEKVSESVWRSQHFNDTLTTYIERHDVIDDLDEY